MYVDDGDDSNGYVSASVNSPWERFVLESKVPYFVKYVLVYVSVLYHSALLVLASLQLPIAYHEDFNSHCIDLVVSNF